MHAPFIPIQCPSCGSTRVDLVHAPNYRCEHCGTHFLYQAPRPPAPASSPASSPVQSRQPPARAAYGPSPYAPTPQVQSVAPGGLRRVIGWIIFTMLVAGGSAVSAVLEMAGVFDSRPDTRVSARTPTPTPTPTPAPRKTPVSAPSTVLEPPTAPTPAPDPDPKAVAPNVPAIAIADYQALAGCECRTDVDGDGRRDEIGLYLMASTSAVITSAGTQHFVSTAFAVAGQGVDAFALPVTAATAPAEQYPAGRFALGVGCQGDTLIIAALDSVSAWSLKDQRLRWTKPLQHPLSRLTEGTAAIDCRSLPTTAGTVKVRTEGGTESLRVDSGDLATAPKPKPKPTPVAKPTPVPEAPTKPPTRVRRPSRGTPRTPG